MNTLFKELYGTTSYGCTDKFNQSNISIKDTGEDFTAEVILAGFSKKDISITTDDKILEIKAKNESRQSDDYRIKLNGLVSIESIQSKLKDGILTLTLPKLTCKKKVTIAID